jgi:ABC-2 type transport system permease protein
VTTPGFTPLVPLAFASTLTADPATMPGWLRVVVEAHPVTWMTTAIRGLMGGGATLGQVALALAFPAALTLVLAPVTLWLYARK